MEAPDGTRYSPDLIRWAEPVISASAMNTGALGMTWDEDSSPAISAIPAPLRRITVVAWAPLAAFGPPP